MCGINGFMGDFKSDLLDRMNLKISHRGPDDGRTIHLPDHKIGLAHRRLSIIDLNQRSSQPMWDHSKRLCIVFNGEIYNYKELKKDLQAVGHQFLTKSDTEVILELYKEYGTDLLNKLDGIFAFAIYDSQSRELFLARDHFGIKPLYYTTTSAGFLFSSEIKAILEENTVSRHLNTSTIINTVRYLWSPENDTALENISRLGAGQAIIIKEENLFSTRPWTYYKIPYSTEKQNTTSKEAIEQVRELLFNAVEKQLVSDVPVGTFLSGGLDSSSILAMATQIRQGSSLPSFTIQQETDDVFKKEGFVDDYHYAKKMANHVNSELFSTKAKSEMASDLSFMLYHLDEPQADFAPLLVYYITKNAKENGIKVLLSGAGGDDIFTGYRRHLAVKYESLWSWLPKDARAVLQSLANTIPQESSINRRINQLFRYASLDRNDRLASYFNWIQEDHLYMALSSRVKQKHKEDIYRYPLSNYLAEIPDDLHAIDKMLYLEMKGFLTNHNLNYTDKLSMANGVEVRVPLLDKNLVDHLASNVPVNYKIHRNSCKWIFKKALEPYIPQYVINRPKTGFGVPLRKWMNTDLKELKQELFSADSLKNADIFDYEGVKKMDELNNSGRIDLSYPLLSIMCITLWHKMFVEKPGVRFI